LRDSLDISEAEASAVEQKLEQALPANPSFA
jgi:hypothetical protein